MNPLNRVSCKKLLAAFSLTLFLNANAAHAEEYDMTGKVVSHNKHNIQEIAEGHMILFASMEESVVAEDYDDTPWKGVSGTCGGVVEIKGKEMKGNGFCTFTDAEKDKFVLAWEAQEMNEKGGPKGVWKITGGSGKYEKAEAGGTYTDLADDKEPTQSTVHLTGKMMIP